MHLRNSWLKGTVNREQYNIIYIITVPARLFGEKAGRLMRRWAVKVCWEKWAVS